MLRALRFNEGFRFSADIPADNQPRPWAASHIRVIGTARYSPHSHW
jgi:hypothetical protein